jgi:hypothetical protein
LSEVAESAASIAYPLNMRESVGKASLLVVSLLLAFIAVEVISRLFLPTHPNLFLLNEVRDKNQGKFFSFDPLLGWDGKENVDDELVWSDCRHSVEHNQFGYRGTAHDYPRNDKRRLVFLGDSFVWGFGVENREIFTSLIETKSNRQLEVVNLGVPGYGTDQELLLWKTKGYKWKPDEVVLMVYYFNDLFDILSGRRYGYDKPYFSLDSNGELQLHELPEQLDGLRSQQQEVKVKHDRRNRILKQLTEVSSVFNRLLHLSLRNDKFRAVLEEHQWIPVREIGGNGPFFSQPERKIRDAQELLFEQFAELNADVAKHDGRLTVVFIPAMEQVYSELWKQILETVPTDLMDHFQVDYPNRIIADWCKQNDISFIDLLPDLSEASASNPYLFYPRNQHLTKYGHEIVANAIGKEMGLF